MKSTRTSISIGILEVPGSQRLFQRFCIYRAADVPDVLIIRTGSFSTSAYTAGNKYDDPLSVPASIVRLSGSFDRASIFL